MIRLLPRRTVLRGAGGLALGLPLLEIMSPRRAQAAEPVRRFLVWSTPNGTVLDRWICKPGPTSTDFALSEILSPLSRHKANLVGIQNLQQHGGHAHHFAASLTARSVDDRVGRISAKGISVDQLIAERWEKTTPVASLQVGVGVVQHRDGCAAVSWAGAGRPLPPENNPFALHARIFGDARTTVGRSLSLGRSALDDVLEQERTLTARLGRADRAAVQEYFESLRLIERQMVALARRAGSCPAPATGADPSVPGAKPWWLEVDTVPDVIRLQIDLITAIFTCDLTRVVTFNLAQDSGAHRTHGYIPEARKVGGDWHFASHLVEKGQPEALVAIERWYYGRLAGLCDKLEQVKGPDGRSLLWSSLIMTNNEYGPNGPVTFYDGGKGNLSHYARMMPYLLLGQAAGGLKTGRYLSYPIDREAKGPPHNQLLVGILNALGIPETTFGDPRAAQGPLPGLLG